LLGKFVQQEPNRGGLGDGLDTKAPGKRGDGVTKTVVSNATCRGSRATEGDVVSIRTEDAGLVVAMRGTAKLDRSVILGGGDKATTIDRLGQTEVEKTPTDEGAAVKAIAGTIQGAGENARRL
jgi:hypothetical protein